MADTIIPTATMRRGELVEFRGVPEELPESLANFEWPKDCEKKLNTVSKVFDSLFKAHHEWTEAHEEWQDVAPAADQQALEEAIRAGKPDPGTPHTTAADRAEHVAWTKLQLILTDTQNTSFKHVLSEYLLEQGSHLAEHELSREQAHTEATRKASEIMAEAENGSNKPGIASAAIKQYIASRWTEDDDHDTLLIPKPDDDPVRKQAIAQRNEAIMARWSREASGKPEPAYDITTAQATELGAAAAHGSTEAKAELKRRRAASVGK